MTTAALQRFAELSEQKTELNAELNKVKAELKGLNDQVMEYFVDAGIQSTKLASGRSVFLYSQWRPRMREGVSGQELAIELRAADMGEFTTANWSSLGAEVRDMPTDDEGTPILPDGLAHVLEVIRIVEPRSRKAS